MSHPHATVIDTATAPSAAAQPLAVRPATQADDADVNRITVAAYLGAGHFPDATTGYMTHIQDAAQRRGATDVWVVERAGVVIAAVTLAELGNVWADIAREGELEFRLLVVDPEVQRSGAGSALVRSILDEGRRRAHIRRVVLTTNPDWVAANALYPRLGFALAPERAWVPSDAPHLTLSVYTQEV